MRACRSSSSKPLRLNRGHQFDHIDGLRWKGRLDQPLFRDAAGRGYHAILTLDVNQLSDADECRACAARGCTTSACSKGEAYAA